MSGSEAAAGEGPAEARALVLVDITHRPSPAGDENTAFGEALLGFLAHTAPPDLSIDDRLSAS